MKKTQIMAVLVVFLAAALFIGATAAANTDEVESFTLTPASVYVGNTTDITATLTLTENPTEYVTYLVNNSTATLGTITIEKEIKSGTATFTVSSWDAGSYTIYANNSTSPLTGAVENATATFAVEDYPTISFEETAGSTTVGTAYEGYVNLEGKVLVVGLLNITNESGDVVATVTVPSGDTTTGLGFEIPEDQFDAEGKVTFNATLKIDDEEIEASNMLTITVGAAPGAATIAFNETELDVYTGDSLDVEFKLTGVSQAATIKVFNESDVEVETINVAKDQTEATIGLEGFLQPGEYTFTAQLFYGNEWVNTTSEELIVTAEDRAEVGNTNVATTKPTSYDQGVGIGSYYINSADGKTKLKERTFEHTEIDGVYIYTNQLGILTVTADTYSGIYESAATKAGEVYLTIKTATPVPTKPISGSVSATTPVTGSPITLTLTLNEQLISGATTTVNFGDGSTPVSVTWPTGQFGDTVDLTHTYTKVGTYTISYTYTGTTEVTNKPIDTVNVVETVRTVASQGTAFVYETIQLPNAWGGQTLSYYSSDATPVVINTMKIPADAKLEILKVAVDGKYGTWYLDGSSPSQATDYINIWLPELALKAELTTGLNGATSGDSVDGKTINKNTEVSFLIEAPKVGQVANLASAKIVFTTPVAGKTTVFGVNAAGTEVDYKSIAIDSVKVIAGYSQAGDDAAAGTYTAQAEFASPIAFKNYAAKSNTVSFTVQSSTLTITASKDSVVRSNPFTVTVGGDSKIAYAVYLESISTNEINPTLQDGQVGFQSNYNSKEAAIGYSIVNGKIYYESYNSAIGGIFETDASGKRNIQFNTAANTEDKTYTVKVSGLTTDKNGQIIFNSADYDKVKVKVEKGAVTISASGDGSYYIGDEIKLTGTNTDSTLVFLFITGQNLAQNGIQVKALPDKIAAKDNSQPVAVKTDNTWEYKWDTSKIALDTGAYTIYATSRLTNGKSSEAALIEATAAEKYGVILDGKSGYYAVKLSDSEYATVSINLKQPFLSAIPSGTIVAKGDKIYIRGTAEGDPSSLNIFIFGPNFFEPYSVSVEDDGSYEKKIEIPTTMSSNQYFVVVQHPMYNDVFDAKLVAVDGNGLTMDATWPNENYQWAFKTVTTTTGGDAQSFIVWGSSNKLQGSQAADALTKMIDSANIDDIYTKLTFTVAEPWIRITNPGDKALGSKFTITGTTNLAVDDQILVEVMSSSFSAIEKTSTSTTSGVSQATKVVAGEGTDNTWSVDVDTTNWKLDEYSIKVNGIEVDVTTTTNFNLVEKPVTTTPTTAVPTGATPTATTAKPTETPKTPGFGAFIALAGLGAVALLVLRRN
ncbi:MAG TPA: MEMAR_RS02690 family S-layer glycoprotein [Methanocorpusculum sp.]|nr:MEMAR_RS02690 family S-layer glycoprotein [Methanocorpusculum sp.]HJK79494.1 MEMAR_RS02690 family S-layer glycoprotein [Methanocorpusculum sp.]